MVERLCPTCGEPEYPHETITNWLVAQAAQWPGTGIAVWRALWPHYLPLTCLRCGRELAFQARRTGADWQLICPVGHVAQHAEHKPAGAAAQCSPAQVEDYRRAVGDGVIVTAGAWPGWPEKWHERSHDWQDACYTWGCQQDRRATGKRYLLAIPQVVRYRLDNGLPCTLITDRGDATAVYETLPYFKINPAEVPVRTTTEVLNDLTAALRRVSLSENQVLVMQDIATRLWRRLPWEHVKAFHPASRTLIRAGAIAACGCAMRRTRTRPDDRDRTGRRSGGVECRHGGAGRWVSAGGGTTAGEFLGGGNDASWQTRLSSRSWGVISRAIYKLESKAAATEPITL